jgi:hypothetical protein
VPDRPIDPPSDSLTERLRSAALHVQHGDLEGYVLVLPDLLTDAANEIERLADG